MIGHHRSLEITLTTFELVLVGRVVGIGDVTRHHRTSYTQPNKSGSWHTTSIQRPRPSPSAYKYPLSTQRKGSNFQHPQHLESIPSCNTQLELLSYLYSNSIIFIFSIYSSILSGLDLVWLPNTFSPSPSIPLFNINTRLLYLLLD